MMRSISSTAGFPLPTKPLHFFAEMQICPCKKCSKGHKETYIKLYKGKYGWCHYTPQLKHRTICFPLRDVGDYKCHFTLECERTL